MQGAELAAEAGVRVYTIGIGGGPVGVQTPFGTLMQRAGDLDPDNLRAIAEATGGRSFEATDTRALERVYEELDRLEPSVRDQRTYRPMRSLYPWPAAAALLISVWLALAPAGLRREVAGAR
jgi:Ca-activated chloride channel family protein